jgi:DNA primase
VSGVFQSNLEKNDNIKNYLHSRKISDETLQRFAIGYVPGGNFFCSRDIKFKENFLDLGLIINDPDKNTEYDLFRDRIMFPIRDIKGHTLGFGGRINPNNKHGSAKYINSKDSALFKKHGLLYGLFEASVYCESTFFDCIYVEEGYVDVIASHEAGILNSVACCGTAITPSHIELLFKHTDHIVFVLDGDSAGMNAIRKAVYTALPYMTLRKQISYVKLDPGMDPAEYIQQERIDNFKSRLNLFCKGFESILLEDICNVKGRSDFYIRCLQMEEINNILENMDETLANVLRSYFYANLRI